MLSMRLQERSGMPWSVRGGMTPMVMWSNKPRQAAVRSRNFSMMDWGDRSPAISRMVESFHHHHLLLLPAVLRLHPVHHRVAAFRLLPVHPFRVARHHHRHHRHHHHFFRHHLHPVRDFQEYHLLQPITMRRRHLGR